MAPVRQVRHDLHGAVGGAVAVRIPDEEQHAGRRDVEATVRRREQAGDLAARPGERDGRLEDAVAIGIDDALDAAMALRDIQGTVAGESDRCGPEEAGRDGVGSEARRQ